MIMLPSAVRIFRCTRSTDLRRSFDGLSGLVQECFSQELLTGHLFLFLNRRTDRIKILYFDRDGRAIGYNDPLPSLSQSEQKRLVQALARMVAAALPPVPSGREGADDNGSRAR